MRVVAVLVLCWAVFVALIYREMRRPPGEFAAFMAKMPGIVFLVLPFETLWTEARGGTVGAGAPAPDFTLPPLAGGPAVHLASFRGQRPVVLIFGSYT